MIPQVALILWILISISLFATLSPLRAFLLTYIVGLLFLPVEITDPNGYHIGSIVFTQSLRIEKITACHIGAILGTLFFAPHVLRRFRFQWLDLAFALVIVGQFLTSIVNDLGAKDGFSSGVQTLRDYLPFLILARLYIISFADLLQAMRTIIGAAFVYSAICVIEWRLSPQFHTYVYGYFQHAFDEAIRGGHFRPIGFLRHFIELSSFMALASILGTWLWFKHLFRPLWGFIPAPLVLAALLIGLAATMTFSGIGGFLLSASILCTIALLRSRYILLILPLASILWMAGRYSGAIDASTLLNFADSFDSSRASSLQYRLESEQLNLALASQHLLLGQGVFHGAARNEEGYFIRALDAQWLINLVFFGLIGLAGWFLVWFAAIYESFTRWKKLAPDARALAAIVCILLGAQFIDFLFNCFPSMFLLILAVGLTSALQRFRLPQAHPLRGVATVVSQSPHIPSPALTFTGRGAP